MVWYGTLSTKEKINIKIDNLPPFRTSPIDIKVEEQRHSRVPYLQPRQNSLMILWLGGVTRLKREFNIIRSKENPLSNHPLFMQPKATAQTKHPSTPTPYRRRKGNHPKPLAWSQPQILCKRDTAVIPIPPRKKGKQAKIFVLCKSIRKSWPSLDFGKSKVFEEEKKVIELSYQTRREGKKELPSQQQYWCPLGPSIDWILSNNLS